MNCAPSNLRNRLEGNTRAGSNLRKIGIAHTFHFLVECPYADFQRLVMMDGDTDGHLIVQSQAETIRTGREIDLEHIVGWAIKHRYLGTLDREDEDD